uniref:hypothetical protein n=1 Tax=Actinomadura sp. SCN-SB TaxID=3373092 RepID=UPI003750CB7D
LRSTCRYNTFRGKGPKVCASCGGEMARVPDGNTLLTAHEYVYVCPEDLCNLPPDRYTKLPPVTPPCSNHGTPMLLVAAPTAHEPRR